LFVSYESIPLCIKPFDSMKKKIKFYIAPYHYINASIYLILIIFVFVAIQAKQHYDSLIYFYILFISTILAIFLFQIYSMKKNYYIEIEYDNVKVKNSFYKSPLEFNKNDIISFEEKKRYYQLKGTLGEVIINKSLLSYADKEFIVDYFQNKS